MKFILENLGFFLGIFGSMMVAAGGAIAIWIERRANRGRLAVLEGKIFTICETVLERALTSGEKRCLLATFDRVEGNPLPLIIGVLHSETEIRLHNQRAQSAKRLHDALMQLGVVIDELPSDKADPRQ